jgi:hypothetical protein
MPPVLRMREKIDGVFLRFVGPIARTLCDEEFERWRQQGQVGPSALRQYIERLSLFIDADLQRRNFVLEAGKCIQLGGNNK